MFRVRVPISERESALLEPPEALEWRAKVSAQVLAVGSSLLLPHPLRFGDCAGAEKITFTARSQETVNRNVSIEVLPNLDGALALTDTFSSSISRPSFIATMASVSISPNLAQRFPGCTRGVPQDLLRKTLYRNTPGR